MPDGWRPTFRRKADVVVVAVSAAPDGTARIARRFASVEKKWRLIDRLLYSSPRATQNRLTWFKRMHKRAGVANSLEIGVTCRWAFR
jgi:hypothetical protein